MSERQSGFGTRAVHGATSAAPANAPASLPIFQSGGWIFRDLAEVDAIYEGRVAGGVYGTDGNPNLLALEAVIASLEDAPSALVTAGGMAAFAATFFALLRSGERVIAARELYGNTIRLLDHMTRFGVSVEYVDTNDLAAVERALAAGARMLVVETVSNPRLRVADVPALARLAHAGGALLLVDNSFASPYHCRPLAHGADLVMESATKFLGGHHDLVLGALAGSAELIDPVCTFALRASIVPGAFDAWLAARSIETLEVRMARGAANALALARRLEAHPRVRRVHYPALTSHPDHDVAARVLGRGSGSMLSFEIDGGAPAVDALLARLQLIKLVLSLGGTETTLSHPAKSSHRGLSEEQRRALGIHDGFIRMSVGIEELADIEADLERGLAAL